MVVAGEVARLAAAVLRLFVRLVATVVATVAETVSGNAAVVSRTASEAGLARVLVAKLPCNADEKYRPVFKRIWYQSINQSIFISINKLCSIRKA